MISFEAPVKGPRDVGIASRVVVVQVAVSADVACLLRVYIVSAFCVL